MLLHSERLINFTRVEEREGLLKTDFDELSSSSFLTPVVHLLSFPCPSLSLCIKTDTESLGNLKNSVKNAAEFKPLLPTLGYDLQILLSFWLQHAWVKISTWALGIGWKKRSSWFWNVLPFRVAESLHLLLGDEEEGLPVWCPELLWRAVSKYLPVSQRGINVSFPGSLCRSHLMN